MRLIKKKNTLQVPSLLSLGNSFGPGNNYNQQNYQSNRYPPDRAQVRGHSGPGGPMKNQRPQPYNKVQKILLIHLNILHSHPKL